MATVTTPVTAEELLVLSSRAHADGYRIELIDGEVRTMSPGGYEHGAVIGELTVAVGTFVKQHNLGSITGAETGFIFRRNPDTVRAPDLAFIHKDRVAAYGVMHTYWPGVPDLAVEVVSFNDTVKDVHEKARDWIAAGTLLVWVVNPRNRTVTAYKSSGEVEELTGAAELNGGGVLPGFRCPIDQLFVR
jgi:Uma2 family endonuclease